MFFGFKRCDSVTQILFELGLPSFNTLLHNRGLVVLFSFVLSVIALIMLVSHVQQLVPYNCLLEATYAQNTEVFFAKLISHKPQIQLLMKLHFLSEN